MFAQAVAERGYDFNAEFRGQLEAAFSGSGYALTQPGDGDTSRTKFLRDYGRPLRLADAYLDIVPVRILEFPALGYFTNSSSAWVPVGYFQVRLVSAKDNEVLDANGIVAAPDTKTPPDGREAYVFEEFSEVIQDVDTAIEGMRQVAAYVARTIATDLRK